MQPFSILGHNGEINTIAQLREQSEQLGLPITRNGSDSQDLNRLLEGLIFEKGLSLLEAVEFALPPILGEVHRLPAKLQDLYVHYREALGPYAQGPVGAGLPRRGTRWSSRWTRWACGRCGGSRPRTCTSSPPSRASCRWPSSPATPPRSRRARRWP